MRESVRPDRIHWAVIRVLPMSPPYASDAQAMNHSRWFAEQVQPYEPALRAYLHGRFPTLVDQDDIVQDTYTRLLRAREAGEIRHPRAFLFTTARNAALDFFRRKRPVSIDDVTHFDESAVLIDRPDVAALVNRDQELEILADAVRALPDRCRQVIMLRYLDGLAYKEIALQLSISPETVKTQMATGMRRCAEYFRKRGLLQSAPATGARVS
jgi:RNA polymerase sigma-70 factor (ECF subfamily)